MFKSGICRGTRSKVEGGEFDFCRKMFLHSNILIRSFFNMITMFFRLEQLVLQGNEVKRWIFFSQSNFNKPEFGLS